jgi:hypothetical protein
VPGTLADRRPQEPIGAKLLVDLAVIVVDPKREPHPLDDALPVLRRVGLRAHQDRAVAALRHAHDGGAALHMQKPGHDAAPNAHHGVATAPRRQPVRPGWANLDVQTRRGRAAAAGGHG